MKILLNLILIALISGCQEPAKDAVSIHTKEEGEPISKYVYGQFIEHLGRSVYGGLWAEMVQDRKFFYAIKDNYDPWGIEQPNDYWGGSPFPYMKASPWGVLGGAGTVKMDSIAPFTGKYAAQITLPGNGTFAGICQDAFVLLKDKDYIGYICLAGESEAAPVVIRLVTSKGDTMLQKIDKIAKDYAKYPLGFKSVVTDSARLEIVSAGKGVFRIGTLSLMPADNIDGWRADVVALLKQLNSPIYRWPGGNFVSGYDWRNGVGERDKRLTTRNPAWTGIEPNDVGIHEFINLMKIIDSEPFIAVNLGLGSVEDAIAEVQYCNGDTTTVEGKNRKLNGAAEPFKVKYWAVGNEMFGSWQLGFMPIADYQVKHNKAAAGIRKADSTAQLIAVGDIGTNWSLQMLTVCGEYMNLLSEHQYSKEGADVVSHINALAGQIKTVADAHRAYRKELPGLEAKDIRIALDEYNYWYGPNPYGELGIIYHQKDALGVAKALHEMYRNSDLYFMANYAQTVNVLGCIKTNSATSALEATALPLILYRNHYGTIPVKVANTIAGLDIVAAYTPGRDSMVVAVVSSLERETSCRLNLDKGTTGKGYNMWTIANSNPMAYNEPGKEPQIVIRSVKRMSKIKDLKIPAYSIVMVKFAIKNQP